MVEFAIDKRLKEKIGLMIERVNGKGDQDNYLIVEGDTGSGKTNCSIGICHEIAKATGRPFNVKHIFFDMRKAIDFAKSTKEQIIIFDEPAFDGLKAEWRKKVQIDLVKLLFTARKKRHFIVFNLVKFNKLNTDIIEKAVGMIRVYQRDNSKQERRFLYYKQSSLKALLDAYTRTHTKKYASFVSFHGTLFRYVQPEIIDNEEYDKMKDEAIMSIGVEGESVSNKYKEEWFNAVRQLDSLKYPLVITSASDAVRKVFNKDPALLTRIHKLDKKPQISKEMTFEIDDLRPLIIHKGTGDTQIDNVIPKSIECST